MSEANIIAASPVFGGRMTRPYRIVLRTYLGGYVTHRMYLDSLGGFDCGHYLENNFGKAVGDWMSRVQEQIDNQYPVFDFPLGWTSDVPASPLAEPEKVEEFLDRFLPEEV